jgi:hypothetical protein
MKRIILVLYFLCLIQVAFGQDDYGLKKTGEVAAEYVLFFSNLGFSAADIIIHNGYWDLYDSIRTFHELDLAVLSKKDLRLLRNAIYARHGLIFKSGDLQDWFSRFSWYKPQYANVDDKLTWNDKVNISKIQTYENPAPNRNVTAADLIGYWEGQFPVAAGSVDAVNIYVNGTIEFGYNSMNPRIAYRTKGTYHIENGYLVVMITEQNLVLGGYFMEAWGSVFNDTGNPKRCKLVYDKPVRAVFPVGEMQETAYMVEEQKSEVRTRMFGSSLKFYFGPNPDSL